MTDLLRRRTFPSIATAFIDYHHNPLLSSTFFNFFSLFSCIHDSLSDVVVWGHFTHLSFHITPWGSLCSDIQELCAASLKSSLLYIERGLSFLLWQQSPFKNLFQTCSYIYNIEGICQIAFCTDNSCRFIPQNRFPCSCIYICTICWFCDKKVNVLWFFWLNYSVNLLTI